MKKMLMFMLLIFSMSISATPKVNAVAVKMNERTIIPSSYDTTFNVLNNSISVYTYGDHALAVVNEPIQFKYRIKVQNKWYIVSRKDFSIFYYGKKLNRKDLLYIKKFAE